ncbi:hypothetical protein [Pseudonocardia hierapolitana]|nr:hypothetical protein [Pseudonocardia hierapolitana]
MAAGRRAGGPGELLSRGSKLVEASPELSRLVGEVRGRLLEAGKGAAVAVASRQVEALTDRVGRRVESFAGAGVPQRGKAEEEPATDQQAEDEAEYERDEYDRDGSGQDEAARDAGSTAEQDEEPAEERAPAPPRRTRTPAAKATAGRSGRGTSASAAVKRTASGTGRATGRKPARATRTRRDDGDG